MEVVLETSDVIHEGLHVRFSFTTYRVDQQFRNQKQNTSILFLSLCSKPIHTLCPKKVVHRSRCQFLTDFQNSFTAGKPSKFPTKYEIILAIIPSVWIIPSVCYRTNLRNSEVRIWVCGNLHKKKQSKNRVTFDKNWNWNVSLYGWILSQ